MRKQRITSGTVAAVALLVLSGCGSQSGSGDGESVRTEPSLTDADWTVDSVTAGGEKLAAPPGTGLELTGAGRATVRACNSIRARVTVHGHSVTVSEGTSTMKACPGSEAFDGAFARAFSGRLTADIDGSHLRLTGEDGDAIDLTYEPDVPLVGTEWTVNAFVRGGTATGIPQGTDGKAHFTLGKKGTVEGNQGCNGFSGTAETSGSTVTFGRSVSTAKLCSGPEMTLEREVGKVMEGRVAYELDHRTLTLTGPDGRGVSAGADGPARLK